MMKRIYSLHVFLFLSLCSIGQSAYPSIPYTNLADVISDGTNILAVGTCDQGMLSQDNGQTWQYFDFDEDAYRIALGPDGDATKAYVLAKTEVLYLDAIEGTISSTGITSSSLFSGNFVDFDIRGNEMFISGTIGIYKINLSDNFSMQIGELDYPSDDRIESSVLTENFVYTCTRHGRLFKSNVEDASTELVTTLDLGNVKDLTMASDDVGYLGVSGSNQPYKTIDGGQTWTVLSSFSETATVYSPSEDVVLSVNTNRILVSTDGGQTSEYIGYSSPDLSLIYGVRFLEDGTMLLVGASSMILRSEDYGVTYENLNTYSRAAFYSIDLHGDGTGIAASGENSIVVTSDNGDSWSPLDVEPVEGQSWVESAIAMGNGEFLLAHNKGITKLSGATSELITTEDLILIRKSVVGDYLLGVRSQGGSFLVKKSVDNGVTWETKAVVDDFSYQINQSQDGSWYLSNRVEGEVFVGSSDAEAWEARSINLPGVVNNVVHYSDDLGLYSVGNNLYKTSDGGATFSSISSAYAQNNIYAISEDHYILTTGQNSLTTVRQTKDGGDTWKTLDVFCSQSFSSDLEGDRFWMGQRGGHLNYTKLDLSTSSQELEDQKEAFDPSIILSASEAVLRFEKPASGKLFLYSQSGAIIKHGSLDNQLSYTLNLNGLTNGIYFYQIVIGRSQYSGKIPIVH